MDIKLNFLQSNFLVCLQRTKYSLIYTAVKKLIFKKIQYKN